MKKVARKEINKEREKKKLFLENFNIRKSWTLLFYCVPIQKQTDGYVRPVRFRSNRIDVSQSFEIVLSAKKLIFF